MRNFRLPFFGSLDFRFPDKVFHVDDRGLSLALLLSFNQPVLMLDRMGLSVRNGWLDDLNRVFIYFTLEDALEYLCCGHTKAVSLFGELDKNGLIERKKQGQGKPTIIYVKNFIRKAGNTGNPDFRKTEV